MVFGVCLGLYMGIWVCFIGGIVQVITAIQNPPTEAIDVALGVFRIMGASFVGMISALVCVIPGWLMFQREW